MLYWINVRYINKLCCVWNKSKLGQNQKERWKIFWSSIMILLFHRIMFFVTLGNGWQIFIGPTINSQQNAVFRELCQKWLMLGAPPGDAGGRGGHHDGLQPAGVWLGALPADPQQPGRLFPRQRDRPARQRVRRQGVRPVNSLQHLMSTQ